MISQPADDTQLYDPQFLRSLFDEMQSTYEYVSTLCSFGFNRRWRKQLVKLMNMHIGIPGIAICDLMAGSGETWAYLLPYLRKYGSLISVDFSRVMTLKARLRAERLPSSAIQVIEDDALQNSLEAGRFDALICAFGVKTLAPDDQQRFVDEVWRMLRPEGVVGLVEISVPTFPVLRIPYLFYLRHVVPMVGKLFLGNPDNYRMLARYTTHFGDCSHLLRLFESAGFEMHQHSFFWGCATALVGVKGH